jgi:hypothetical protein
VHVHTRAACGCTARARGAGAQENALGVQEDTLGVQEDTLGVQEDTLGVQEDARMPAQYVATVRAQPIYTQNKASGVTERPLAPDAPTRPGPPCGPTRPTAAQMRGQAGLRDGPAQKSDSKDSEEERGSEGHRIQEGRGLPRLQSPGLQYKREDRAPLDPFASNTHTPLLSLRVNTQRPSIEFTRTQLLSRQCTHAAAVGSPACSIPPSPRQSTTASTDWLRQPRRALPRSLPLHPIVATPSSVPYAYTQQRPHRPRPHVRRTVARRAHHARPAVHSRRTVDPGRASRARRTGRARRPGGAADALHAGLAGDALSPPQEARVIRGATRAPRVPAFTPHGLACTRLPTSFFISPPASLFAAHTALLIGPVHARAACGGADPCDRPALHKAARARRSARTYHGTGFAGRPVAAVVAGRPLGTRRARETGDAGRADSARARRAAGTLRMRAASARLVRIVFDSSGAAAVTMEDFSHENNGP